VKLPTWPPRDWRAYIALWASIAGAFTLTLVAMWLMKKLNLHADRLITEIVRDPKARPEIGTVLVNIVATLAWGLKLLLAGVIAVLLSLGLAINHRTIKLSRSGFEASGGDEPAGAAADAADKVVEGAVAAADEIKEDLKT
jgi:hypothetical protein